MRKFDPWPVFFRREWNRNWPFLVGFAVTGAIITKFSLGLSAFLIDNLNVFMERPYPFLVVMLLYPTQVNYSVLQSMQFKL
ncbi:hypothetical protein RJ639_035292 [Escallonia herrerae]|uniref:Uncharacterized protein n=1 Tax=Escallonia herrerae TaxID=1293975 RepID=A0AA88WPM9_9ASTE|nr:hypothetical protein RJ639_035292 [Escallonia herrerae]